MSEINLLEAHFVATPSQSNVYGLAHIPFPDSTNKLLVAPLEGGSRVICLKYEQDKGVAQPKEKEIPFSYIPGTAEIVSIDAFIKLPDQGNGIVIGITFIDTFSEPESEMRSYINIYSPFDEKNEYNLDEIAGGCFSHELSCIPYQLCHVELPSKSDRRENVFLLSGSDKKIHMFREETKISGYSLRSQDETDHYFPELKNMPSIILWLEMIKIDEHRRMSATGCQNGFLQLSLVDELKCEILQTWCREQDFPVTSVKLFNNCSTMEKPDFLASLDPIGEISEGNQEEGHSLHINLLVTSSIDLSIVYSDVVVSGLSQPHPLPESNKFDCVLCTCVADIDFDGENELILGTYGQELLMYKTICDKTRSTLGTTDSPLPQDCNKKRAGYGRDYAIVHQQNLGHPLLAVHYLDVTGDGLCELAVLSLKGLHILQHNLQEMKGKWN